MRPKSKKVVFFFPSFASSETTAPLGILAVAAPLLRSGYSVKLVDSTITPNYKQRALEEVKDAVCLAISLVTGPMIRETAEIRRAVKAWNVEFPIILGDIPGPSTTKRLLAYDLLVTIQYSLRGRVIPRPEGQPNLYQLRGRWEWVTLLVEPINFPKKLLPTRIRSGQIIFRLVVRLALWL